MRSPTPLLLAAVSALLLLSSSAEANSYGTRAGARAGYGSMVFTGGQSRLESEIQRTDDYGSQALAHGVLRTGALHAAALAHYDQPPTCHLEPRTCLPSAASAQVEVWDTLTFSRADMADPSQVRWRFEITGIESRGPLSGGSASARFAHHVSTRPSGGSIPAFEVNPGDVLAGTLEMTGDTMVVYFYAGIAVDAFNGGTADYSHTALFQLDLPRGVSFTSSSGVFMADRMPTAPVPEPPALALGLAGLATLAWLRRRRTAQEA